MTKDSGSGPRNWNDWANEKIAGRFSSQEEVNSRLALAAQHCNLLGGMSVVPVQSGYEVLITIIPINMASVYPANAAAKKIDKGEKPGKDDAPAKWGIGGDTIESVGSAAHIDWQPYRRMDDGRDPRYVDIEVTGSYDGIDGNRHTPVGRRPCDLRDGSDEIEGKSPLEVAKLRSSIVRSTETKARLRAIRKEFGIPISMTGDRLAKPFVLVQQIFTGRAENAFEAQIFAAAKAFRHIAATSVMYPGVNAAEALREIISSAQQSAPPALPEPPAARSAAPALAAPAASAPARQLPPASRTRRMGEVTIPYGKDKGKKLSEVDDKGIEWVINAVQSSIEDPSKEQWKQRNEELLGYLIAEREKRSQAARPSTSSSKKPNAEPQTVHEGEPEPPDPDFDEAEDFSR